MAQIMVFYRRCISTIMDDDEDGRMGPRTDDGRDDRGYYTLMMTVVLGRNISPCIQNVSFSVIATGLSMFRVIQPTAIAGIMLWRKC